MQQNTMSTESNPSGVIDPQGQPPSLPAPALGYAYLGLLVASYIGVYLCRKNLPVAVPILEKAWSLNKEQVGIIGSVSTVAYAAGKNLRQPCSWQKIPWTVPPPPSQIIHDLS